MRTLKLTIAYDGSRFVGWQRQADGLSIQGLIEDVLAHLEGGPVTVHGAGRTDAGVHALGQVASVCVACRHDTETLTRAANARLPDDIRVLSVEETAGDFHARFSARSKCYRYQIQTGAIASPFERAYAWHIPEPLDVEAMRTAAALLVGTHDFGAFQSAGSATTETVRTVMRSELHVPGGSERTRPTVLGGSERTRPTVPGEPDRTRPTVPGEPDRTRPTVPGELERTGPAERVLVYEISGTGFLRHMVRAIVGTLVEVGRGRRAPGSITALLAGGSRADAGRTAPPHGLFLVGVDYD